MRARAQRRHDERPPAARAQSELTITLWSGCTSASPSYTRRWARRSKWRSAGPKRRASACPCSAAAVAEPLVEMEHRVPTVGPCRVASGTAGSRWFAYRPRQPALWTVYVNVSDANASGSSAHEARHVTRLVKVPRPHVDSGRRCASSRTPTGGSIRPTAARSGSTTTRCRRETLASARTPSTSLARLASRSRPTARSSSRGRSARVSAPPSSGPAARVPSSRGTACSMSSPCSEADLEGTPHQADPWGWGPRCARQPAGGPLRWYRRAISSRLR